VLEQIAINAISAKLRAYPHGGKKPASAAKEDALVLQQLIEIAVWNGMVHVGVKSIHMKKAP